MKGINTMKKVKTDLKRDTVQSDSFHVGIELELVTPYEESQHDDDACRDSREESQRDYLNDESTESILRDHIGLGRSEASSIAPYFDRDQWINDYMSDWSDDGCQDDECSYGNDGSSKRNELQSDLKKLTGNTSFKVVADGSVEKSDGETDAEVCWNYFASKETIKDNEKIMEYLNKSDCTFNKSCGLHINLNNYLKVNNQFNIPIRELDFLFNFVAQSRQGNSYCNKLGLGVDTKYSMIYHQGDRLEFRFFSPTLDAEKLNHYVVLANTVYKRLAGKNAKLPKKSVEYFLDKMQKINKLSLALAVHSIECVNTMDSYEKIVYRVQNEDKISELTSQELRLGLSIQSIDRLRELGAIIDEAPICESEAS